MVVCLMRLLGVSMAEAWSDQAKKTVTDWQERSWGDLAISMGFGWAPKRAFEAMSPPVPSGDLVVDTMRNDLGSDLVADRDRSSADITTRTYLAKYLTNPPTPYESPLLYSTLTHHLDIALEAMAATPWKLAHEPRVATLPSGDLNAKIRKIRHSNEVVVFYQHGLIEFLDQMAIVMGAAIPIEWLKLPLPKSRARQDEPGDASYERLAVEQITESLTSYIVHGNSSRARRRPLKGRALASTVSLAAGMRNFLLCHELIHLLFGHLAVPSVKLPRSEAWQREFDADMGGSTLAVHSHDEVRVFKFWTCDIALWSFQMIERALFYLDTGANGELPATHSHPTPTLRRLHFLEEKTRELWELDMKDLSNQLGELIVGGAEVGENLWEATIPHWDALRRQGVRPSPLWKQRLEQAHAGGLHS